MLCIALQSIHTAFRYGYNSNGYECNRERLDAFYGAFINPSFIRTQKETRGRKLSLGSFCIFYEAYHVYGIGYPMFMVYKVLLFCNTWLDKIEKIWYNILSLRNLKQKEISFLKDFETFRSRVWTKFKRRINPSKVNLKNF